MTTQWLVSTPLARFPELNFKYKNTQVYCSGFLPLPEVSDVDLDDEEQEL